MRSRDLNFKLGKLQGWFSTGPETLTLGAILVRRFGQIEFHLGLIIAEFCVSTTEDAGAKARRRAERR